MAPAANKVSGFYREGNAWFTTASLPTDINLVVDGVYFHLHKFPLISKCSKIAKIIEEMQDSKEGTLATALEEFPGGADAFLLVAKYCYSGRVEFTARNVVMIYCAADYLEMTEEYGEGNLVSLAEGFLHKTVLRNWKDCILALHSCEPVIHRADKLHIISKCSNALSVMVCTDPSLFGWPMLMYGSLQSPGGSILWNGINTGAKIESIESDWWFEDVSYLCVPLFERLIKTMEGKGIRPEILAGAIMYYSRKHLPGLGRWHVEQTSKTRTVASFSMTPATIDQKVLLESVVKLLPEKKGKSFCRFLLGALRVALILGVNHTCQETLERRIGLQLDLATLDGLLIPSYSDSDTLYNTDCVEQMIHYFLSSGQNLSSISPSSANQENSLSRQLRKVAKLVDSYIAEVASDVNLKPGKLHSLARSLPESSRTLHDGLYRAIDIYLKVITDTLKFHHWLHYFYPINVFVTISGKYIEMAKPHSFFLKGTHPP
ncbi:hypothetical protein LIER_29152 [Lithospermum erythrorhizon]|uniref:Phototropic-responsive NPH3 family protein n=1 Tax=Lithospermum erythrorhizon TaxID=34254 RepID=A0AAV3RP49_LITER